MKMRQDSKGLKYRPFENLVSMIEDKYGPWNQSPNTFEMLPVGEWDRFVRRFDSDSQSQGIDSMNETYVKGRLEHIASLKPDAVVNGTSLGRNFNYSGFVFDDLAILSSPGYGNAIYVFKTKDGQWLEDVKNSKYQILSGKAAKDTFVKRITHNSNWQDNLLDVMTDPNLDN